MDLGIVHGGWMACERKRKDYASQVQLHALRKGPLTSKLARASPRPHWPSLKQAMDGMCISDRESAPLM
eukprot:235564-Pelagomonas_calceolata.AAC.1